MSIQSNINQSMSLAGFLFAHSPAYAKFKTKRELGQTLKYLDKEFSATDTPRSKEWIENHIEAVGKAKEQAAQYAMMGGKEGPGALEEIADLERKMKADLKTYEEAPSTGSTAMDKIIQSSPRIAELRASGQLLTGAEAMEKQQAAKFATADAALADAQTSQREIRDRKFQVTQRWGVDQERR